MMEVDMSTSSPEDVIIHASEISNSPAYCTPAITDQIPSLVQYVLQLLVPHMLGQVV